MANEHTRDAARPRGRPKAFNDATPQNTIKSLDRALHVLAELARMENATLTGLAQELSESPATVYRVLTTFQGHGIVDIDEAAQTWHVGPNAFLIGSGFLRRTSLIERSRPVLRKLMEATGETANLGIENDGEVLFVSQVETHASIRAFFPPGTKSPAHASGIGKALLAHFPKDRLDRVLSRELQGFTPHTLTRPEALLSDLEAIRARGYSVDNEERNEGMRCIAAPIRNTYGETIAGISVSGPTSRVGPDQVEALALSVREAAEEVSASLGAKASLPTAGKAG
ncbi:IclR family transcriptional regulator [Brevirhabdus pacifica]|uniref:IclR family transcriptional regulator n=1 Tax=Brevirhabdus pacifica TaxID=1267768 RepID=A0A1U7DG03_9RHOB|nr:HTH-type transcriptional regulator BhcR [Brevirhabdus pacifica]APX88823.1 IclR family transcriptional regulator [Brevirhabdus pacifica]OWU80066.1 IclR family transcriptional regulator [Loktanella sp. 22II-4b]PJJ86642.1 IclR family transcriptional regulator [Brevirhabdus pacifica]